MSISRSTTYRIKVLVGAKVEGVAQLRDGRFLVSVSAQRKGGLANARVLAVLAGHFGLRTADIHIASGHKQPTKTVQVRLSR